MSESTFTNPLAGFKFQRWMGWAIAGLIIAAILGSIYNGLVDGDLAVKNTWGEVQVQYQRRMDVINTEVSIVGAAANHETDIFDLLRQQNQQADALGKLLAQYKNTPPTGPEAAALLKQLQAFDASFVQSQIKFNVYVASNPQITSMPLYENLQVVAEGSENRIGTARRDYNNAVTAMQGRTRHFPGNLFAGLFGFHADDYSLFSADEGAQHAPIPQFPTRQPAP